MITSLPWIIQLLQKPLVMPAPPAGGPVLLMLLMFMDREFRAHPARS